MSRKATVRSVITDPLAGDVLLWKEWTIRVTRREPAIVHYTTKRSREPESAERTQDLSAWAGWTPQAKVMQRGSEGDNCTPTSSISGARCVTCRETISGPVHLVSRKDAEGAIAVEWFCFNHCPLPISQHPKARAKKAKAG